MLDERKRFRPHGGERYVGPIPTFCSTRAKIYRLYLYEWEDESNERMYDHGCRAA